MNNQKMSPRARSFVLSWLGVMFLAPATTSLAANPTKETFLFPDSLFPIGSCNGFDIVNISDLEIIVTTFFNNNGDFVRQKVMFKVRNSIYFNSEDPSIYLDGGPGEVEIDQFNATTNTLSITGAPFKVTVPGQGVIFLDAGRTFIDFNTGEVTYSGPSDFEEGNVDALCDALTIV